MTQRIFDIDNPQDVKDLFDILPDKIQKIYPDPVNKEIEFYDKDGVFVDSCERDRKRYAIMVGRPSDVDCAQRFIYAQRRRLSP